MRRVAIHSLVAVLSFSASLLTYKLWPVPTPSPEINRPLVVSICELDREAEIYDGKVVQVKAVLYRGSGGNPYIANESCGSPNAPLTKMIDVVADSNQMVSVLPKWATYTSFCANDTYAATVDGLAAEAIIVGIFKIDYPGPNEDPDSRQSQIIPQSVVQLSVASKRR